MQEGKQRRSFPGYVPEDVKVARGTADALGPKTGLITPAQVDTLAAVGTPARVRAYNTLAQTILTGTITPLSYNSTRYNVGGTWVIGQSTRFTANRAGLWTMGHTCNIAANTSGRRLFGIRLNGTLDIARSSTMPAVTANTMFGNVSCEYAMAVGDYVEMWVFHEAGVSLTVDPLAAYSPEAWFRFVCD